MRYEWNMRWSDLLEKKSITRLSFLSQLQLQGGDTNLQVSIDTGITKQTKNNLL